MKLRNTTSMAFQAAIAVTLAEFMSMYFKFDRGYWVTLTAMVLTTQTWGESVKRSLERVGMTVLGGCVGTILYFLIPPYHHQLFLILLLVFVFLNVYMVKIYHLWSVFFLTCFVVFLFALINQWNLPLLHARILDTAVGAAIALSVGFLFFSTKTDVTRLLIGYLQKMEKLLTAVFQEQTTQRMELTSRHLSADFQKIKKDALAIRYELLFHRIDLQEFNALLTHLARCTQQVINLTEVYHWLLPYLSKTDLKDVQLAVETTSYNIKQLIEGLQSQSLQPMVPATNLSELLQNAIAEDAGRFTKLKADTLGFYSLMYFFTRLNTNLNEIGTILVKS